MATLAPTALCACGCGTPTSLATFNFSPKGYVKGQPMRFFGKHGARAAGKNRKACPPFEYTVEDRQYKTPCWVWQRGTHARGYGLIHVTVSQTPLVYKSRLAHVVYWERVHGPVPDGLELDHLCRITACCNPDHMEAVTHAENVRRGFRARSRSKHGAR